MQSGRAPSPLSTGGVGVIFEYRVAATVLAAVLRGDRVEGLDIPVTEVRLQQRNSDYALDDVVAFARRAERGPVVVEFQVKRTLAPVRSNPEWASVVRQCLEALNNHPRAIERGEHRLGIAAHGPARPLTDLAELARWVRAQPNVDAVVRLLSISGAVALGVRERWTHLCDAVGDALADGESSPPGGRVEEAAYRIASALVVWVVEVEDGERDHRGVLDRLGDLVPPDRPEAAHDLFVHLIDLAQRLGPRAGGIDRGTLVAELERRGVRIAQGTSSAMTAPGIVNLPPRSRVFTGRERLLGRVAELLSGSPVAVVAAHGLGGVGKSQVALEYAHRHRAEYAIAWWVRAESPVTAAADLAAFGTRLGLPSTDDLDEAVAAVKAALSARSDWLLIFDNAPTPGAVAHLLPAGGGHILITSRTRDWGEIAAPLQIDVMTADEALAYLRTRTGSDENQAAALLADQLGHLPLALAQAGGYIAAYSTTITGYLELYETATARMLAAGPAPTGYPQTVATTWLLHFEALTRTRPVALELLELASFVAPDAIPLDRLLQAAPPGALPQVLAAAAADPVERDAAIGALAATNLFDRAGDGVVAVHRLVQQVTRDRMPADRRRAWAARAVNLIMSAYPDEPDQPAHWDSAAALTIHGLTAAQLAAQCGTDPTAPLADLLNAMGIHLAGRADLATAKDLYERALALKTQLYGADSAEAAVTLDNLGLLLTRMGQPDAAQELHHRAHDIKLAALGPNHPTMALNLTNRAAALAATGDHAGAVRLLRQALAIEETVYGPDHPEVASDLRDIGIAMSNAGEPRSALTPLRRALRIYESVDNRPDVARTLDALGCAHLALGEHEAAREQFEQALLLAQDAFGAEHPQTARTLANLGNVLDDLGDYRAARAHLDRALAILETQYGPDHPDIAIVLVTLTVVLENLGERDQIRAMRCRAYRILHATLGPEHPNPRMLADALGEDASDG
jgi:tetratricopeptide (TPR) repeat protein